MDANSDAEWLKVRPEAIEAHGCLSVVDLFAGCGGMSLGLEAAAAAVGYRVTGLAVEMNPGIAQTFAANFQEVHTVAARVETIFDGNCGEIPTASEDRIKSLVGKPDFLVGGPPCQGHSDLNNHTRRADPRNLLYLRMARAAEVLEPRAVVIENVPSVVHDQEGVVDQTIKILQSAGYSVHNEVVSMVHLGVPQTRRRHVLIAAKSSDVVEAVFTRLAAMEIDQRTVRWAIEDILDVDQCALDKPARRSEMNVKRMKHLFDENIYDLPNEWRPPCHRDKEHSYTSVYGRLRWDLPAPTITTGFTSMGQGRYVHPERQRTLTPHEAARLQCFPDWFDWQTARRTLLSTMIGNAVPPLLMARLGAELLSGFGGTRLSRECHD